jgi:uncharacterized protein
VTRALIERGDHVIALSRDAATARDRFGPLVEVCDDLARLDSAWQIDAIVNLAGEALVSGRWTAARKRKFIASRVGVTAAVEALVARLQTRPAVLVSGSAVGYYGDRGDTALDETSTPQAIFLSTLCRAWEEAAERVANLSVRVCRLRLGFVLGRDGGALPPLALATRCGVGSVLGSGRQFLSWIHRDDVVRLILFAIDTPHLSGAVNATSPFPATQREFMHTLAAALDRRIRLRVPAAPMRVLLGDLADLFLTGQRVTPAAATTAGFRLKFPHLDRAFADIFRRQESREGHTVSVPPARG